MTKGLCLFIALLLMLSVQLAFANDTGVFDYFLNIDAKLPLAGESISADDAAQAVRERIEAVRKGAGTGEAGLDKYWSDYRKVLEKYNEVTTAKPVLIDSHGKTVIARFLVGVKTNGAVGGFFAVDPNNGSIQSELMWSSDFKPLWILAESTWNKAQSVNEMVPLAELIPPFAQFTTGVPVDPKDSSLFIVDGIVDALPVKGQEERAERVDWVNNEFGTSFKFALKDHKGRRTGSSKCMSIAASYLGDWWTVRTGNDLPSYVNGVGGQMEYGFNPRMLECRFYEKANERHFLAKYLGNFKVAPMSKDRVTGEKVPYSPRGYSRILTETDEGSTPDNLVSEAVKYETTKNHFSMDQKPHIAQIFTEGFFPKRAIKSDLKNVKDSDFPFTLHKNYGEALDVNSIKEMLETWGPLLGQHMGRNDDGTPKTTRFGMGVHCIMIIGTGLVNGEEMLVYRETFGNASPDYLEDSFLGPTFRAMPIRFFYQAIAFPHHLYVEIDELKTVDDGNLGGMVTVKTNRGMDNVDVDAIEIFVDGKPASEGRAKHIGNGQYRLWLPGSSVDAGRVDIRVSKKYFADKDGNNSFGIGVEKSGSEWTVNKKQLVPVKAGF